MPPDCNGHSQHPESGSRANQTGDRKLSGLTVLCTLPNDPELKVHHVAVPDQGEHAIVLSRTVADYLQIHYEAADRDCWTVQPEQYVTVVVSRQEGDDQIATEKVDLLVKAIIDIGESNVGYVDCDLFDQFEKYQLGHAVPKLQWPVWNRPLPVTYQGYLSFSREPLSKLDHIRLTAHGLTAKRLDAANSDHKERYTLGGLLANHSLHVHYFTANGSAETSSPQLTLSALKVEEFTDCDDIVIPWSEPVSVQIEEKKTKLMGVSLRKRWLSKFFRSPGRAFRFRQTKGI